MARKPDESTLYSILKTQRHEAPARSSSMKTAPVTPLGIRRAAIGNVQAGATRFGETLEQATHQVEGDKRLTTWLKRLHAQVVDLEDGASHILKVLNQDPALYGNCPSCGDYQLHLVTVAEPPVMTCENCGWRQAQDVAHGP